MYDAGEKLKQLRDRLGLTTREVALASVKLAKQKRNDEFLVSGPWLSQLENNSAAVPSIFKLYSLSALYGVSYADLLRFYGVDTSDHGRDHISHRPGRNKSLKDQKRGSREERDAAT